MWAHYIDSWANFSLLPTKEKDAKETTLTISNVLNDIDLILIPNWRQTDSMRIVRVGSPFSPYILLY